MKRTFSPWAAGVLVTCTSLLLAGQTARAAEPVSLFDGKTLAGWKGKDGLWSVQDGAIVGSTKPDGIKGNTFLVHEKPFEDFVLTFDFKLEGGNSGVQVRSAQVEKPEEYVIAGYQADIGAGYFGSLYDERRRGMLAEARKDWVERFLKKGDWNRYEVHAIGNRITLKLNGLITAEYLEKDDAIPRKGVIALQLHGGGPMEVRFKDLKIEEKEKKRLLYVTTAAGFAHSSRPLSRDVVAKLGRDSGEFTATTTDTTELITPDGLKAFDGVMFYSTGGKDRFPLSPENREAMIAWIKDGHAFLGVHSATDTYADWEPYWEMIGGSFDGHPWNAGDPAITIDVEDPSHPAALSVPQGWKIQDEIYQFKNYSRDRIHVILSMNAGSVQGKGKRADGDYAIAWCRDFGKGKVFYTSLGHREDVWTNPTYQAHLLGGILWTFGAAPGDATAGQPKPSNEFTALFDGKTLSGWTPNDGDKAEWVVLEGGIVTGKGEHGHLFSLNEYENFHYKAEVKINDGGNSGMYFRARKGQRWPAGFEAQVNSTHTDPVRTGSLYGIKKVFEQHVPPDTWFTQEIIANGNLIIIKVNGKVTAQETVRDRFRRGRFAFQFHDPTCKVEYRNVMVRELPPSKGERTASR
jgi:type 1 glutamine amidotransferase